MTNASTSPSIRALRISACALTLAAGPALAEDSQPLSSRMMQMLGLGGDSSAAPAQPAPAAPAAAPAAPAGAPGQQPSQSRVLRMLGLTHGGGGDETDGGKPRGLEECPDILVDGVGAGAEMRSPANAPASEVAYQIAITRMARECALSGDEISVRVGLLGAAMLGAVGKPGAYYGSIRVALRRKSDNQLFGAKTYRIGATIPANQSRADFTLLVEDISAPFISSKAADDYEVLIGFMQGGGAAGEGGAEKPRRKRRGG